MRRFAAIALIVAGVALPVCAQRSGFHGGFSGLGGHSAPAFHGGFSSHSSAPAFYGGFSSHAAPAFRGGYSNHSIPAFRGSYGAPVPNRFGGGTPRSAGAPFNMARGSRRGGGDNFNGHRDHDGRGGFRRPYISPYSWGIPYGYPGWIDPYFLSNPDDSGYDDSSQSPNYASESNAAQPPDEEQVQQEPPPSGPYRPTYDQPQPAPASENAVTLVFKDGRPSEQIHNYALTRSTLYVLDQDPHHPDIPTDQLDLAATAKVNHDAGVDFRLPDTDAVR